MTDTSNNADAFPPNNIEGEELFPHKQTTTTKREYRSYDFIKLSSRAGKMNGGNRRQNKSYMGDGWWEKGYKGPFWVMESPISWRLCSYPCTCDPAETHKIGALCILSLSYFKILFLFRQIPITVHSLSLLFPSLLASCSGILQRLRLAPGAFLAAEKEKSIMHIKACQ